MGLEFLQQQYISPAVEAKLRSKLIFAQDLVVDREILTSGDGGKYGSTSDPTVQTYTPGTDLTAEPIVVGGVEVRIDQQKATYQTFDDADLNKVSLDSPKDLLRLDAIKSTGEVLADNVDSYIASLYADAGVSLGSVTISTGSDANKLLIDLIMALVANDVPQDEVNVAISPDVTGLLMQSGSIVANGSEASDARLLNGLLYGQRLHGARVFSSSNVVESSSNVFKVMAWHKSAIKVIENPLRIKYVDNAVVAGNWENSVTSLLQYGAGVVNADRFAVATVTVS